MGIPAGTYTFGPENGTLWVKTGRGGAAAAAGHDLLIQVTGWQATLEVGADPAADEPRARGGRQVLAGARGLRRDAAARRSRQGEHPSRRSTTRSSRGWTSSSARPPCRRPKVASPSQGDLTLVGNVRPLELDLEVDDYGKLNGSVVVTQSDWGIEPYSALFGALKVADEVEITINAAWRGAAPATSGLPTWESTSPCRSSTRASRASSGRSSSSSSSGSGWPPSTCPWHRADSTRCSRRASSSSTSARGHGTGGGLEATRIHMGRGREAAAFRSLCSIARSESGA